MNTKEGREEGKGEARKEERKEGKGGGKRLAGSSLGYSRMILGYEISNWGESIKHSRANESIWKISESVFSWTEWI